MSIAVDEKPVGNRPSSAARDVVLGWPIGERPDEEVEIAVGVDVAPGSSVCHGSAKRIAEAYLLADVSETER